MPEDLNIDYVVQFVFIYDFNGKNSDYLFNVKTDFIISLTCSPNLLIIL